MSPIELSEAWTTKIEKWQALDEDPTRIRASVTLLANNAVVLGTILGGWSSCAPGLRVPQVQPPAEDREAWAMLWGDTNALAQALHQNTGLPLKEAAIGLRVLLANRLVYPDGSVSTGARSFLAAEAAHVMRRVPRKKAE